MKLIKRMLMGMVSLALLMGQDPTQGGGEHQGDHGPPTNHWEGNCGAMMSGQSEYWLDSDGDGQPEDGPYAVWTQDADGNPVQCGPGPDDGPQWLTFEEVDADGSGTISRDEARAKYGTDPQGNEVPDFDQRYDEVDVNGSGDVDPAEYQAAMDADQDGGGDHDGQQGQHDGQGGDHDDKGGQCRYEGCDFVGNSDEEWHQHCEANPDHCRPQAGDTCGWGGKDGGDACGYVFTGEPGEDHHHCDSCGAAMSSPQDMDAHCQANPDHCQGGPGGGPNDGPPNWTFEEVDADGNGAISRDEARAKYGTDPMGNPVPDFDQRFDEVDANGSGDVDPAEHAAAQNNQGGGPGGPPQAGDTCGYVDANGNTCGYTFTGTMADADHKHN